MRSMELISHILMLIATILTIVVMGLVSTPGDKR